MLHAIQLALMNRIIVRNVHGRNAREPRNRQACMRCTGWMLEPIQATADKIWNQLLFRIYLLVERLFSKASAFDPLFIGNWVIAGGGLLVHAPSASLALPLINNKCMRCGGGAYSRRAYRHGTELQRRNNVCPDRTMCFQSECVPKGGRSSATI